MFPYPSGAGLHVGHPEGYTATDILCRYQADAAASTSCTRWAGTPSACRPSSTPSRPARHPRITTEKNIDTFRRQIKMLGFSYDWDREVDTTDPDYFKWTQWIFLQLFDTWYDAEQQEGPADRRAADPRRGARRRATTRFATYQDEHRLAYQAEVPVNWCPALGTVLANEEVIDGKSERGGHPVVRLPLRQWMLRITAYAERLLDDLEPLDWSRVDQGDAAELDRPSEGAEVDFCIGADATSR